MLEDSVSEFMQWEPVNSDEGIKYVLTHICEQQNSKVVQLLLSGVKEPKFRLGWKFEAQIFITILGVWW